jgi:hypothetical protein
MRDMKGREETSEAWRAEIIVEKKGNGELSGNTCWVVAIACAANGWHQPLTIGSHHFPWLGNLPCLTLQPCLTAEQVEQLP